MDRALATPRNEPSHLRRLVVRAVLGTLVFGLVGYVGHFTILGQSALDLIWSAAGVGVIWLATGTRRTWPTDVAALTVANAAVNLATDSAIGPAVLFAISNQLQVIVIVVLVRRWVPEVWGLGGTVPLHRLADLGRLVAAALIGCLVSALTGALGLWLTHADINPLQFPVWWGRNTADLLVTTVLCLVTGPPLLATWRARDLGGPLHGAASTRTVGHTVEGALLVAVSGALYGLLFGTHGAEPLAFLVLSVSVWAGLRFTPAVVMAHGLATGVTGLAFTMAGSGPFADIDSTAFRALVGEVFVLTTVLTGLVLVFSRLERDSAATHLADARRESDERARLLRAVLDSMNEGLVVVEDGGRIVLTNTATPDLLGIDDLHRRLRPAAAYGLFHADGTPLSDDDLPGLTRLEEVPPEDFHLRVDRVPQGRVLEIGVQPLPAQGPQDRALAMINIRDVTLDRQHRDALASFAGVVAHDLFNPLTVITGWAESLSEEFAEGPIPPDVGLPMVERLHGAADHMRHVIGDLLAYTVARDQSLRPEPVDLTSEIRALATLRGDVPSAPVISVAPGMQVWGDPGLVRQLFDNLLGNAVKYVARDVRPRIDVRAHRDDDWLQVRVSDNGIGIPEDERELVFESFHRANRDGYQGTGLGLAICRRIADRHGGSIHAEQGPDGVGTTFVVRLPANASAYAEATQPVRVTGAATALAG